jgi:hypothetical protein
MLLPTEAPIPPVLELRQEAHVITQTLTRDGMTITTIVTLGTVPTDTTDNGGTAPDADIYGHDNGGLSSAELGAIIGSVAAFVLLLIIGFFCFANSRRRRVAVYDDSSYGSGSFVEVSRTRTGPRLPRRPPPVAERIPGGPKYPTYRALPIKNPRNPRVRHVV